MDSFEKSGFSFISNHREKAKRKAEAEIKRREKEHDIKHAKYELIEKDSPEGKASVYFKGLNSIYSYAINIIYYHHDDDRACPSHSNAIKPATLICH